MRPLSSLSYYSLTNVFSYKCVLLQMCSLSSFLLFSHSQTCSLTNVFSYKCVLLQSVLFALLHTIQRVLVQMCSLTNYKCVLFLSTSSRTSLIVSTSTIFSRIFSTSTISWTICGTILVLYTMRSTGFSTICQCVCVREHARESVSVFVCVSMRVRAYLQLANFVHTCKDRTRACLLHTMHGCMCICICMHARVADDPGTSQDDAYTRFLFCSA